MTIEEIEAVLDRALPMRTPRFPPDTAPRVKVAELEDYLMESAYVHGELVSAGYWLDLLIDHFKEQIESMVGWEVALGGQPARATKEQVLAAKRQVDPVTFDAGARARRLRDGIRAQISRLEYETQVVSRAYTLISGG